MTLYLRLFANVEQTFVRQRHNNVDITTYRTFQRRNKVGRMPDGPVCSRTSPNHFGDIQLIYDTMCLSKRLGRDRYTTPLTTPSLP